MKPICTTHRVEMLPVLNGATVFYPIAQYIYIGDIWECPTVDCLNGVFLRTSLPMFEIFHEEYHIAKEKATMQMWNL